MCLWRGRGFGERVRKGAWLQVGCIEEGGGSTKAARLRIGQINGGGGARRMAGQLKGQNVWPRWGGVAYGRLWGGADPRWGEATPPDDVTPRGEQHAAATCGRKGGGGRGSPAPIVAPPFQPLPPRRRRAGIDSDRWGLSGGGKRGGGRMAPTPHPTPPPLINFLRSNCRPTQLITPQTRPPD